MSTDDLPEPMPALPDDGVLLEAHDGTLPVIALALVGAALGAAGFAMSIVALVVS